MNMISRRAVVLLGFFALLGSVPTNARADRQDELQERFKSRYGQLVEAKAAGKVGETTAGVIEAVDGKALDDPKMKAVVEEENADRRELYKLIAEKEKTTEDKVAERNAARNFQKAGSGEYLKGRDGSWKKKK